MYVCSLKIQKRWETAAFFSVYVSLFKQRPWNPYFSLCQNAQLTSKTMTGARWTSCHCRCCFWAGEGGFLSRVAADMRAFCPNSQGKRKLQVGEVLSVSSLRLLFSTTVWAQAAPLRSKGSAGLKGHLSSTTCMWQPRSQRRTLLLMEGRGGGGLQK